jgi:hypothetical protein
LTVVLIEGFDHYNTQAFLSQKKGWLPSAINGGGGSGTDIGFNTGRLGGNAVQLLAGSNSSGHTNTASVTAPLPATYTTLICGFAFYPNFNPVQTITDNIFQFQTAAGAAVCTLQLDYGTSQLVVLNAAGTVVATAAVAIVNNNWTYLELKVVVAGASGTVTLRQNGVVDANVNNLTANLGSTAVGRLQWVATLNQSGAGNAPLVDDIYALDTTGAAPRNDFLGDCRVETLYPRADGANLAWTPDSGTAHFSRVNEHPPDGDTSYVADATAGDRDTYLFQPLSTVTGAVYGVQTNLYARKSDAATRQIAAVIRQAGTNHDGATSPGLSTSYLFYSQLYNQDPTGSDWTIATVNADEYGVKEVV